MFMPDSIRRAASWSRNLTISNQDSSQPEVIENSIKKMRNLKKNLIHFNPAQVFTALADPQMLDEFEFNVLEIHSLEEKH